MAKFKKKPTMKEMANVVVEINKKVNEAHMVLRQLDDILGLYIKMKGDMTEFRAYLDKMVAERTEEHDKETDGNADKPNLQGDTDGESSGTEGVRQEAG
jgi:hypothetical protein